MILLIISYLVIGSAIAVVYRRNSGEMPVIVWVGLIILWPFVLLIMGAGWLLLDNKF